MNWRQAEDFDTAVHDLIKCLLSEHRRIIFNGNGYSQAWVEEAEKRGLPNITDMIDAIPALVTEKSVKLFEEFHVFTRAELESRAEVEFEAYAKAINIEARTMIDMASKQFIPAVIKYTTVLADSLGKVMSACPADRCQRSDRTSDGDFGSSGRDQKSSGDTDKSCGNLSCHRGSKRTCPWLP